MLCTVFDFGDFRIEICLFVLYCIVLCSFVLFVRYVFFPISSVSDCCVTEFEDLRNDMYVCMYVCNEKFGSKLHDHCMATKCKASIITYIPPPEHKRTLHTVVTT